MKSKLSSVALLCAEEEVQNELTNLTICASLKNGSVSARDCSTSQDGGK